MKETLFYTNAFKGFPIWSEDYVNMKYEDEGPGGRREGRRWTRIRPGRRASSMQLRLNINLSCLVLFGG